MNMVSESAYLIKADFQEPIITVFKQLHHENHENKKKTLWQPV